LGGFEKILTVCEKERQLFGSTSCRNEIYVFLESFRE